MTPLPSARGARVAGLHRRRARAGAAAAVVALSVVLATPGVAFGARTRVGSADPVADADAAIARLRQEADALAGRYFEAVGQLAAVQQRIDEIEARLPALTDEVATRRAASQERAVVAYRRSGHALAAVIGAGDPMQAARRVQWLGRLNARDRAASDALRATATRLGNERASLRLARAAAADALTDVRTQGEAIDALLVAAQERRRIAATPPTTPTTAAPAGATAIAGAGTTTTTVPPVAPPTYVPTPGTHPHHDDPFLVCLRTRESSGNYAAVNPAGPYLGAYQFLQSTWNSAANHAGLLALIGVPPNVASPYDQDDVAWWLYQWQGTAPWGGLCG